MTSHLPFYALFNDTLSLYSRYLNLYLFKMFHTHTLENKFVQIKRRIEVLILNVFSGACAVVLYCSSQFCSNDVAVCLPVFFLNRVVLFRVAFSDMGQN